MPDWTVYDVFIASPLQMNKQRDAVEEAIREWGDGKALRVILMPRRWEQLPGQLATEAQEIINRTQVEQADILIAVFDDRRGGGGAVGEIELFISHGKGQGAMVYFSEASREDTALKELRDQLQGLGLVKEFKDLDDLTKKIRSDLTPCIRTIQGGQSRSWPRLQRTVAEINSIAPYPLAQYLTDRMLSKAADEMRQIRFDMGGFKSVGLRGYIDDVHWRLRQETRTGTMVFAICGEKGLRDYSQLDYYFRRFYEFAEAGIAPERPDETFVVRVFVEQGGNGPPHSEDVQHVIDDHKAAPGVIALTVTRQDRSNVNHDFPGICEALDVGFGVVIFVRQNSTNVAIVHQGQAQHLAYAAFERDVVVNHLIKLTYLVYQQSTEYRYESTTQRKIDEMFSSLISKTEM